jgi:hypothetical protein
MVWRIIKNFVFYIGLLVLVAVALHYIWAPRYYFPKKEVFYGNKIFNPYQEIVDSEWQKVGVLTYPVWYRDAMERLSGNDLYNEVDEYYYDTVLHAANQRFEGNGNTYMQGLHHNDHLVIGSSHIEYTDYPFIRDIHNKQHRIRMIRRNGGLVFLKPSVFYDNYDLDHLRLLRNYYGVMVDENFTQSLHIWDQTLSAGHYNTLIANTLPQSGRFLPEKQYRIMYVKKDTTSIRNKLRKGNYFVATTYNHQSDDERPDLKARLKDVAINGDELIIETTQPALAFNFFGQNGEVLDVQKETSRAAYQIKREDSYVRVTMIFEDGTRYYLNPVHRYAGNVPHNKVGVEVNFLKTWLLRSGGIVALLIFIWVLLYIKRRLRIEILEPKE